MATLLNDLDASPESHESSDASAIGWISTAEVFLLFAVVLLAAALLYRSRLLQTQDDIATAVSERDQVNQEAETLRKQVGKEEIARKSAELRLAEERKSAAAQRLFLESRLSAQNTELRNVLDRLKKQGDVLAALEKDQDLLKALLDRSEKDSKVQQAKWSETLEELRRLRGLNLNLIAKLKSIEDRVMQPLRTARLVVYLRCKKMPEGLDLNLYLQDPDNQRCDWMEPRIRSSTAETGTLIRSQDVRNPDYDAEEIFYSREVLRRSKHPYLIFCMLRRTQNDLDFKDLKVEVELEVVLKQDGKILTSRKQTTEITSFGDVWLDRKSKSYKVSGLEPVGGFEINAENGIVLLAKTSIPAIPRGLGYSTLTSDSERFKGAGDPSVKK